MKITREEHLRLKRNAQQGDYESILILLDSALGQELENYVACTTDHRYKQGAVHALQAFRKEIVKPMPKQ